MKSGVLILKVLRWTSAFAVEGNLEKGESQFVLNSA